MTADEKHIQDVQNKLLTRVTKKVREPNPDKGDEVAEDMVLAFELLTKYKKDKDYIQKDIKTVKKQGQTLLQTQEEANSLAGKTKGQTFVDPLLTQEERHRLIAEKRQQRKMQQTKKEEEEKEKERARKHEKVRQQTKQRVEKLRRDLKTNSDLEGIIDPDETPSTFITQKPATAAKPKLDTTDPRQSLRIQKVREAK